MSRSNKLDRRAVARALLEGRDNNLLVVTGLGSTTYDGFAAGDHDLNFYLWGAMGGAAVMGLGIALAQPDRKVLVITGDGEMLMGLGALATIGVQQPANLSIVAFDNAHYGETGMQASHTGKGVDLVGVAKACGIPDCRDVNDMEGVAELKARIRQGGGTLFARVGIAAEETPRALPTRDGVELKLRFRKALGV